MMVFPTEAAGMTAFQQNRNSYVYYLSFSTKNWFTHAPRSQWPVLLRGGWEWQMRTPHAPPHGPGLSEEPKSWIPWLERSHWAGLPYHTLPGRGGGGLRELKKNSQDSSLYTQMHHRSVITVMNRRCNPRNDKMDELGYFFHKITTGSL